jgi:hypothetical protein
MPTLAEAVLREVGTTIVLALPLDLGKATSLFAQAVADRSIKLAPIFTALSLEKPHGENGLERRRCHVRWFYLSIARCAQSQDV